MLAITTGIITLLAVSPGLGIQVFASNSNGDNDEEDDDSNDESDKGESGDRSDSGSSSIISDGGGSSGTLFPGSSAFDPKASDPNGVITPANETISTYENKEYGFEI